jgi:hypothetical protein
MSPAGCGWGFLWHELCHPSSGEQSGQRCRSWALSRAAMCCPWGRRGCESWLQTVSPTERRTHSDDIDPDGSWSSVVRVQHMNL